MSNPPKYLFIVEGADAEPKIFKAFGKALSLDISIYEVRTNIYSLYSTLKKENFQIDVKDAVKSMLTAAKNTSILDSDFQAIYLVFDCDVQDSYARRIRWPWLFKARVLRNLEIVRQMMAYFNDEYDPTKGRLLVNYPMVESFSDINACHMCEYLSHTIGLSNISHYKKIVSKRILTHKKPVMFSAQNFQDLIACNASKALCLTRLHENVPTQEIYLKEVSQERILDQQIEKVKTEGCLGVINTSILFLLDSIKYKGDVFSRFFRPSKEPRVVLVVKPGTLTKRRARRLINELENQHFTNWGLVWFDKVADDVLDHFAEISGRRGDFKRVEGVSKSDDDEKIVSLVCGAIRSDYFFFYDATQRLSSVALVSLKGLTEVYSTADVIGVRTGSVIEGLVSRERWPLLKEVHPFDLTKCGRRVVDKLMHDNRMVLFNLILKDDFVRACLEENKTCGLRQSILSCRPKIFLTDCRLTYLTLFG